ASAHGSSAIWMATEYGWSSGLRRSRTRKRVLSARDELKRPDALANLRDTAGACARLWDPTAARRSTLSANLFTRLIRSAACAHWYEGSWQTGWPTTAPWLAIQRSGLGANIAEPTIACCGSISIFSR